MTIRDIATKIAFAGPKWCWLIGHVFSAECDFETDKLKGPWRCDCGATKPIENESLRGKAAS